MMRGIKTKKCVKEMKYWLWIPRTGVRRGWVPFIGALCVGFQLLQWLVA